MRPCGSPSRLFKVAIVAAVCACLASCTFVVPLVSWHDGVNLIVNGSFEDGTGPGGPFKPDPTTPGIMSLKSGSTSLPGWFVIDNPRFGQDIAWVQNQNGPVPDGAHDGTHFLDLTGASDKADPNGNFGVIRQSFATIPRVPYVATVFIGVRNPGHPGPIRVRMAMSATNSNLVEFAQVTCPYNPAESGNQWVACTLNFNANSDSTLVSIYGELGKDYIGIDSVSVECIAPLGRHAWCGGAPPL